MGYCEKQVLDLTLDWHYLPEPAGSGSSKSTAHSLCPDSMHTLIDSSGDQKRDR